MKLTTYLQQTQGFSRRTITAAINRGEICVNNEPVNSFTQEVQPGDILTRWGETWTIANWPLDQETKLILFHKPVWYVVSRADPHNSTIFELLPAGRDKIYYPIGRLDKDSSWLLLLTNDPKLVHELLHPSKKLAKIYHVQVVPRRDLNHTTIAKKGLRVDEHGDIWDDEKGSDFLKVTELTLHQDVLEITLEEWKKRHIRRLLRALGYRVISLQRISFGPRILEGIAPGQYQEIEI